MQPDAAALPLPRPAGALERVFSYPAFLASTLTALMVLTVRSRFADPDLWWHLRIGETIWRTGSLPVRDTFSYTAAGSPWIAHEWLSEWLLYGIWSQGGDLALMALLALVPSLTVLTVYRMSWLACGNPKAALAGGMIAWLFTTVTLAVRPAIFGLLFLAVELLIIEAVRAGGRKWLWALPPLFALWVNCHPSWMFGLAIAVWYAIASRDRAAARAALWCGAALLLNPFGYRLLWYPLDVMLLQRDNLASVTEWRPLDVRDLRAVALMALAAAFFLGALAGKVRLALFDVGLLLAGLAMAVRHQRMLAVFGILAAPVVCRALAPLLPPSRREREQVRVNGLMMAASLAAAAFAFPTAAELRKQVEDVSPVKAVEYIRRSGLTGPMLNDYEWGGYLMWGLPEHKVFIDGRCDLFDWSGVLKEYGRWSALDEDPALLLDRRGIGFVLLRRDSPMSRVIPYLPGWQKRYQDHNAVLFARQAPARP